MSDEKDPETASLVAFAAGEPVLRSASLVKRGLEFLEASHPTEDPTVAKLRARANAGAADSQFLLGQAYYFGWDVLQDYAQAVAWYRKAAEQGDASAQLNLGWMYRVGRGVPKDVGQAVAWYRKAAEQGYASAQFNLGQLYGTGRGVPQDYVESHKWRNLAASRTSAENQKRYAETRDAVAKRMTPTQIEAAQKLAREWLVAFETRGGK